MQLDGEITTSPTSRPMTLRVSVPVRLRFGASFARAGADTRKTIVLDVMGYTDGSIGCTPAKVEARDLSDTEKNELGPFARKSNTSRNAALGAYPRQGSQRRRVIHALRYHGDSTREELAAHTGLSENSVRPRVRELIEGGWIEETDHTRKTTRGSEAVLLGLTNKARDQIGVELERDADAA